MAWIENVVTFRPVLMVVIIVWMLMSNSMGVVLMSKDMGVLLVVLRILFGCQCCYLI